ncbi:cytidylate kinase [Gigaspora margarita]|uniref:(d)CMP kinase n=1 Tax=Gigaspora margarita TaxID=4874 RepID=A0A8H4A5C3_GIGMA|nr:cytidylate kinase [Gigaspora margarita]
MSIKKKGFNIAIDRLSGVGKSSIGYQVAKRLNFTFIDSGLFYRYFADRFYLDDTIQLNEIHLFKNEMIEKFQIGQKASEISNIPEIQNIINEIIQTITKNGGYVVVGRDATTKILPSTRVKLILEADFETRVYRRAKQLNAKEFEAIGKVFSDLLKHDFDSFDLVLEAKKVATIINTPSSKWLQGFYHIFYGSEEIKTNSQVDSSIPQVKELTVQELIVLKNWELANYIADKAYLQLLAKLEERHEFMNYLKELYELQVTEYEKIEREVLSKNCPNKKLYTDAQVWRKDVLTKSKNATKFQASYLATKILSLELEIDRQEQEREEREAKKQKINQKNEK